MISKEVFSFRDDAWNFYEGKSIKECVEKIKIMNIKIPIIDIGIFYKDQCNLTFEKEDIELIASVGATFCISAYKDPR